MKFGRNPRCLYSQISVLIFDFDLSITHYIYVYILSLYFFLFPNPLYVASRHPRAIICSHHDLAHLRTSTTTTALTTILLPSLPSPLLPPSPLLFQLLFFSPPWLFLHHPLPPHLCNHLLTFAQPVMAQTTRPYLHTPICFTSYFCSVLILLCTIYYSCGYCNHACHHSTCISEPYVLFPIMQPLPNHTHSLHLQLVSLIIWL